VPPRLRASVPLCLSASGFKRSNATQRYVDNERGVVLVVVLFVAFVVGAISAGAALVGSNASLINRYTSRHSVLVSVADAGLEEARSALNGDRSVYPDSGFAVLENGVPVTHADGSEIPGVRRWTYVGPTGVTSGQYGVFGSVVVRVEDNTGNQVIRRGEVAQESFAKYAYFTDVEPANISFGGGDQIQGPVHTNDVLKIYSSGATFLGTVGTARTVQGSAYGTFAHGYQEGAPYIAMPETADLLKLRVQATAGGTAFAGTSAGALGQATTRIEFVAIDLDGDGAVTGDNEGFIRVYQVTNAADAWYVVGDVPPDYATNGLANSPLCGFDDGSGFRAAADLPNTGTPSWTDALTSPDRRCYLGGADQLFGGFDSAGGPGDWLPWTGPVDPLVAGRPDAQYLIPINRAMNPSFKGVVFVDGKVAVSGTLRGRVTVAATESIIIADDVTYASDPASGACADILGMFSGRDIVVSNNAINAPVRGWPSWDYLSYDETPAEFVQGVVLALNTFTVEDYDSGATITEPCEARPWGRGCLYLTGGIIQRTRGAVGTGGATGSLKRYSYDQCAYSNPPPYFPTTGHFARGRYYEVDPVGFNLESYWNFLTPPEN